MPARSSACDPVSAPIPWIIPTPNAVFGPYWDGVRDRLVLVAVDPPLEPVPEVADAVEDEHPAAAHPELALPAHVLDHRDEDPDPEQQQRHADHALEDRIDPGRQHRAEQQRRDAEDQDDARVPDRVQAREADRVPLLVRELRVGEDVERSGVVVLVSVLRGALVVRVPRHRRDGRDVLVRVRRGRGARDVGDGRDVIPVEAVAEPEHGHAREEPDDAEVHVAVQPIANRRNSLLLRYVR